MLEVNGNLFYWWLIILTLIVAWIIVYLYKVYTHLNQFPTPPYVPIFGHVFDYMDVENCLNTITKNVVKYGGVIRQFIGPRKPSLVTANKEFLKFLCKNSKYVCKAKYYRYMKPWLGEGLITSDGTKWLSRRKALTSSLTQTSVLKSFIKIFEEKSTNLLSVLAKYQEQNLNVHPLMRRFTLDVICETAMGLSLDSLLETSDSSYGENIEVLCEVIQSRMVSFLKNFDFFFQFSNDCYREKKSLAIVDGVLERIIQKKRERKRQVKNDNPEMYRKDMLDLMMELKINGKPMSNSDLREEINTIMFAGYDTSSTTMSLVLYQIAEHPDVQNKLFEEQHRIFQHDFDNCLLTYENLHKMEYLDMVIKETLRFHTIVPYVGKKITKDLKYGNTKIPSMLNVGVFIYGFHHNPDYFPEAEKFIPERFANKDYNTDSFMFLPFGVKPRQCLGKKFAMLEMKCTLSKIIRHFKLEKAPDFQLKTEPKLVLSSSSGVCIRLKRRHKNVYEKHK